MDAHMVDNFVFLDQANTVKTKPPDKPPDNDNVVPFDGVKVSFREKMLVDRQSALVHKDIDFLAEGLAHVKLLGGNRLLPIVSFTESVINDYRKKTTSSQVRLPGYYGRCWEGDCLSWLESDRTMPLDSIALGYTVAP
ncbi:unnamed protein product [Lupinus luteus]|uniref:Uncharacterized protein n=1 Tax=Lupinus luteus TaxID=3873 RepID=A0AAV1XM25_LUPLU